MQPLTGNEIGLALRDRWPVTDVTALSMAARAAVPLVQVPPRGLWGGVGQSRSTSAEAWIGRPLAEPDVPRMVRRYLAAYGPAGVRDAQAWSGITGPARVFTELRPELLMFRDQSGVELFDVPRAPRPPADSPASIRFLPDFDQIMLAHFDRSRIFAPEQRRLIFSVNGIIHVSVLVDGFVRALWTVESVKDRATLIVAALPPAGRRAITRQDKAWIKKEGLALLTLTAPGKAHSVHLHDVLPLPVR